MNDFETAVVNEPTVFEPSKFYCICDIGVRSSVHLIGVGSLRLLGVRGGAIKPTGNPPRGFLTLPRSWAHSQGIYMILVTSALCLKSLKYMDRAMEKFGLLSTIGVGGGLPPPPLGPTFSYAYVSIRLSFNLSMVATNLFQLSTPKV